jgi:hypothetical protein
MFAGMQTTDSERQLIQEMMASKSGGSYGDATAAENRQHVDDEAKYYNAPEPSKSDRREWKKQVKQFDQYLRKDGQHNEDGFASLLESGAVWADPNSDTWTSKVPLSQRQLRSIGEGWNQWKQQVFGGDPYYMDSWQKSQDKYRDLYR